MIFNTGGLFSVGNEVQEAPSSFLWGGAVFVIALIGVQIIFRQREPERVATHAEPSRIPDNPIYTFNPRQLSAVAYNRNLGFLEPERMSQFINQWDYSPDGVTTLNLNQFMSRISSVQAESYRANFEQMSQEEKKSLALHRFR